MNRDTSKIVNKNYDLLIIGGGIVGASAALHASLKGLSVLLIDKGDFGGATSAASGKMIHGGIRFMQHGAFLRVRESLHYRKVFLNIAPHLVHAIPFLIPTYGHGIKGKEILTLGMIVYELLGLDKNITKDVSKKIPRFKSLSKKEVLEHEPEINTEGLTGGILYYDCQMHTPERLTLAFVQSANKNSADVINYVKVNNLVIENDKVIGARATDLLTNNKFNIRSKFTLNASGPWISKVLRDSTKFEEIENKQFSKGIHLVTESITNSNAIALATKHKQAKSLLSRGGRHFFIAPWKNKSLIGTTNVDFSGNPDDKMVTKKDIEDFLEEIKDSYKPAAKITLNDIDYFYGGLYIDDSNFKANQGYQGHRHDQIFDHKLEANLEGLISVIGVKYTTSPELAEKVIDKISARLNKENKKSNFENLSLHGGDIKNYNDFIKESVLQYSGSLDKEIIENLILLYGSKFEKVLELGLNDKPLLEKIDEDLPYINAQIIYSIKNEMAVKLTDIFLRRIGNGTLMKPSKKVIQSTVELMARELKWSEDRVKLEISELNSHYNLS